jgi:hypothetical protein
LSFYPKAYLEEYGEELKAVFDLSLDDAMKIGRIEVARVILREMIGLPTAILYEHLRKPKYGLVAQTAIFEKGNHMEAIMKIRWAAQDSWMAILATLLPLWLLSFTIMVEGFPNPPISLAMAIVAFVLAIAISIVLLRVCWLTLDLILYSLFPFVFLFVFDEISTSYKTPFILVCALILSIAMVGAQRSSSENLRWRIWLVINILIWVLASHALERYWDMVDNLVFFGDCFPYTKGCLPLAGNETPWWVLFFSL